MERSEQVWLARAYAIEAHGDQPYGDQPYVVHLDAVAELVRCYGEQAEVLAYLHDVIEDTARTQDDLAAVFGRYLAKCVADISDEPGRNRRERKAATNRKLSRIEGGPVPIVKPADRLANMRSCLLEGKSSLVQMYRKEYPAFRQAIYRPGVCEQFWDELARLSVV